MEELLRRLHGVFAAIRSPKDGVAKMITITRFAELGLGADELNHLPRVSENVLARAMEPMNLILVGSQEQAADLFSKAGWRPADPVSFGSMQKALLAIFFNRAYDTGPVTPCYIGKKRQDAAFQKATSIDKFRQRHHLRLWRTSLKTKDGRPVLVGQASYDKDIKTFGFLAFPPIHKIAPELDAERRLVCADLTVVGAKVLGEVQLNEAYADRNAYRDAFFTDGFASIVEVTHVA